MRDGFPRAPSGSPGRIGVAVSVGDGEQGFSASDMGSRFSLRATDAHKPESRSWSVSFRRGSFWRRLIGKPPGEVEELAAYSTFARIATSMSSDPLVTAELLYRGDNLLYGHVFGQYLRRPHLQRQIVGVAVPEAGQDQHRYFGIHFAQLA